MRSVDPMQVYITVVTLGEIRKGVECCGDSAKRATALHHNLSVVTRNEDDFKRMGIGVTNPWSGTP
jgi:predicted nucleic acid-binding protein